MPDQIENKRTDVRDLILLLGDCTDAKTLEGKLNTLVVTDGLCMTSHDVYKFFQHFDFLTERNKIHIAMSMMLTQQHRVQIDARKRISELADGGDL